MAQVQAARLETLFSDQAKALPDGAPAPFSAGNDGRISFTGGFPDPNSLPAERIAAATARAMEKNGKWALQYGSAVGYAGLIDQLRAKLARDNGVTVERENVLITAGASQAIDLVCSAMLNPGDIVLSEEPTWMGAVRLFSAHRATCVGVPMDNEGMRMDVLENRLAEFAAKGVQPKFIYTIPTFQNPTGVTTPLHRRVRLLELAKKYNVAILEDDAYFDLRFSGERIPMLVTLDDTGLVMYTGTFSKIMSAGMRLGWCVGPAKLIEKMTKLKADGGTSPFASNVAAEYAASGDLEAHVGDLIDIYRNRCNAMRDALATEMPEGVEWTEPNGGFFLWLTLPEGCDSVHMLPEARAHGVDFLPGTGCFFDGSGRRNIRLSFSFSDEEAIRRGVKILAGIIREYAPPQ
ncbi:MAG: PLP-dependent aminotransferase family protein [Thermomicrobia bacterium]|nr:PLP-dependent aminotransferase family protein [Thermomicrobia bacterium]